MSNCQHTGLRNQLPTIKHIFMWVLTATHEKQSKTRQLSMLGICHCGTSALHSHPLTSSSRLKGEEVLAESKNKEVPPSDLN